MNLMRTIEIKGRNYTSAQHTRIACRGIVLQNGKLLLSHESKTGWYLLPGGGLEGDETPEQCCIRELEEETGLLVSPTECFLTLKEYYENWCYITYLFRCEITGTGTQHLTEQEASRGAAPEWVPLREALEIFGSHETITDWEEKRGSYQREHQALICLLEEYPELNTKE